MISYATPIRKLISEADIPLDFLAASDGALARLSSQRLVVGILALVRGSKGWQQHLEFPQRQSGECQELAPILLQCRERQHAGMLIVISYNVYCGLGMQAPLTRYSFIG